MKIHNKNELFNMYKSIFQKEWKNAKEYEMPFAWKERLSETEFRTRFVAYRNANPEASDRQLVKSIVSEQRYFHSEAQGIKIQEAAKKRGYDIGLKEARSWVPEESDLTKAPKNIKAFWDEVRNERKRLFDDPNLEIRPKETKEGAVARLIAVTFFGSPE